MQEEGGEGGWREVDEEGGGRGEEIAAWAMPSHSEAAEEEADHLFEVRSGGGEEEGGGRRRRREGDCGREEIAALAMPSHSEAAEEEADHLFEVRRGAG